MLKLIKKITIFFCLFFSPYLLGKQLVRGRIISPEGQPIESVRVSSLLSDVVTYSDSNGYFILPLRDSSCHSDTDTIKINERYTSDITFYNKRIEYTQDYLNSFNGALFDSQGRIVYRFTYNRESFKNLGYGNLQSGLYLLKLDGFLPVKILICGEKSRKAHIVSKYKYDLSVITKNCPTEDTIFFCKDSFAIEKCKLIDSVTLYTVKLKRKRWVASDIHNHTLLTDGSEIADVVFREAFTKGCLDVCINSEHGGMYECDTNGKYLRDQPERSPDMPLYSDYLVPRWYTLLNYSWAKIKNLRKLYPDKIILQGVEWNAPGYEHASVGFVKDEDQPYAISNFEYMFDENDYDNSLPQLKKQNSFKESTIAGVKWLKDNYPYTSYCFINHPSREAVAPWPIATFRDLNELAPEICFAFEGMPGHHKNSIRGSYGRKDSPRNRTWGGADYIIAEIGGLWDALLGEGRRMFIIVNSDFHNRSSDFFPGEYAKTWSVVTDTGALAFLEGLRTGEIFITHGDLINGLLFSIDDGKIETFMGGELRTASDRLYVKIAFKSPEINNHGDKPRVDHIDLICGSITGKVLPSDIERYSSAVNPTTKIYKRFFSSDWVKEGEWNIIKIEIPFSSDTYYRLRGTNLPVGTLGEVDDLGNPMMDVDNLNNENVAWKDLWFYSNPIFVYRRR
ncbi:MAG: hypothetical protein N2053_04105 [Chitinispirillaceae bacterium]|nr:hypothetical protein [Chitinispirillaceae bacterium]